MGFLNKDTFVCLDCETTGLDPKTDRIIEVALTTFDFSGNIESYETLVDPECLISEASQAIHHISQEMVQGKPKIHEVLPNVVKLIGKN
ncbi:MAG TPA: exonuclease domain-containing protein, partial [Rhabdochlamydiaceae bacterium]|nr:exonuclease domain-containing protein [Rhabdochlamydiaceae bacterium]